MGRVQLEHLTKVYPDGTRAADGVTLDIEHGEFVVLVGPSGCGKSTTLRMIAGLEEISEGRLVIDGDDCSEVPARDRNIAMVFQNYALYPHLSVLRNLSFGLERRRRHGSRLRSILSADYRKNAREEANSIQSRVRDVAATLGIDALLTRKPAELSGGQRQRVAVGRALVRDPKVFLFDEPLSNLDAKLRVEMRAELKDLHQSTGATMIYVTHDQEEAMTLGDRLVVMKDGVVQQCAPPGEVYANPANTFVAGFVGTPPMNFLDGSASGASFTSEAGSFTVPSGGAQGEVTAGVRPDRIRFAQGSDPGGMTATVRLVEPLGDRTDVRVELKGGQRWTVRVDAGDLREEVRAGAAASLAFDPGDVHLFAQGQ